MTRKTTHEEYIAKVKEIHPNIEVLEEYINARTKILHKCKTCGHEWMAKPSGILVGYGCAKCAKVKKLTHDEYEKRAEEINPNIEVLDEYINMQTKILHKCKVCGYEWDVKPNDIATGHGCPICSKKVIGSPPEYKNSIWASEYKEYFSKYITEEQMKSYMPHSTKKVEAKCPNCKRYKKISPSVLLGNGLGCICGDGISYPNKFIYSMLNQLNIEMICEYSPKWANRKKYDVYIPKLNCIIENHGAQHYKDAPTIFGTTYEYQKQNDDEKKQSAIKNGIKKYIVINCKKSNKDWIKQSVIDSKLLDIIGVSESEIDWDECDRFATSNMIKEISNLWNEGMCVKQILEKVPLKRSAVYNCLNKAAKLSMCDYDGKLSKKRTYMYKEKLKKENKICLEFLTNKRASG